MNYKAGILQKYTCFICQTSICLQAGSILPIWHSNSRPTHTQFTVFTCHTADQEAESTFKLSETNYLWTSHSSMLSYFTHNKGPNVFTDCQVESFYYRRTWMLFRRVLRRESCGHGLTRAAEKPLNRESFLFCLISNVPCRIKLCSSLAELPPTQAVRKNKETVQSSCISRQTCGGGHLRHFQGFSELLRHFWPPVFINSLTDEEKTNHMAVNLKNYISQIFLAFSSATLLSDGRSIQSLYLCKSSNITI